jgi:hypothetical protein
VFGVCRGNGIVNIKNSISIPGTWEHLLTRIAKRVEPTIRSYLPDFFVEILSVFNTARNPRFKDMGIAGDARGFAPLFQSNCFSLYPRGEGKPQWSIVGEGGIVELSHGERNQNSRRRRGRTKQGINGS